MARSKQDWIRLIKQAIRQGETAKDPNEAAVFMAKANELMLKYNIAKEECQWESDAQEKEIVQLKNAIAYGDVSDERKWEPYLIWALCRVNMCVGINHADRFSKSLGDTYHRAKGTFTVFGEDDNIKVVIEMYYVVRDAFRRMSRESYSNHRKNTFDLYPNVEEKELYRSGYLKRRGGWVASFLKGAVKGFTDQLYEQFNKTVSMHDSQSNSNQMGLMVVDKLKKVQSKVDETMTTTTSKSNLHKVSVGQAVIEGYVAGKKFKVAKGKLKSSPKQIER